MSTTTSDPAALPRGLGQLFGPGTTIGLDEGRLIERFVASQDASAFEAIVSRHGPMVWGVCRRSLRDPNDAEDAFQATFLILARRARSIRDPGRLGGWLHGVARKVAVRARRDAARRPGVEADAVACPGPGPGDDLDLRERADLLHGEIDRLPDRYRQPVVLCHLEGCTHEEAAERLGWPVGTVRGRLSRGRDRLRDRLTRRGMASALPTPALAPVPALLAESTAKAAAALAAGRGSAALASAGVAAWFEAISRTLVMCEMKAFALKSLAVILVATTGVGALAWGRGHREPGTAPASAPSPADRVKEYVDAKYGFSANIPEPWAEAPVAAYTVPGVIRAAWSGPAGSSIVAFMQVSGRPLTARFLLDMSSKAMGEQPGCKVHVAKVRKVAGKDAMWMVLTGKGTGGAITPEGDTDTTAHWVVVPREEDIVILLLTCPAVDYEARLPSFQEAVKSLKVDVPKAPAAPATPAAGRAALGEAADWGGGGEGYELGVDESEKHSGKSSGCIRSAETPGPFASLTQGFRADAYRGKRLKLSAWAKVADVENRAGLWMRVDGKERSALAFDNMQNRPIRGTSGWAKYEVVLSIPDGATDIYFGFLLSGKGRAWVDDIAFDVVGEGVAPTDLGLTPDPRATGATAFLPAKPTNLGFEAKIGDARAPIGPRATGPRLARPSDWGGGGEGYELGRDEAEKHSGKSSGCVRSTDAPGPFGTLTQGFQAASYRGKRVRMSGFARADGVERSAGLWMRVDGKEKGNLAFDNMGTRPIRGTSDWAKYDVVLDVPEEAESIFFGFLLSGPGRAWVDDITFEVVGNDVAPTAMEIPPSPRGDAPPLTLPAGPANLDFER